MRMIRKQVYVTAEDDAKLKRLAGQRRCSEADLVREGIGLLPDENDEVLARLRAAGLVVERPEGAVPRIEEIEDAERQLRDWFTANPRADPRLTEAVLKEREERDAVLSGHVSPHEALRSRA